MKKSNKLLLFGFTLGLVLIAAIHITLYAKYKNGDYTIYHAEDDLAPNSMQLFPNILFVTIRNVPDATVRFGDVAEVPKNQEENIQYVQKGDTLLITGSKPVNSRDFNNDFDEHLVFNLPRNATLSVFNSSLSFYAGKKNLENNPVIFLQKAEVLFSGRDGLLQLEHVKFDASDSSAILFYNKTQVNQLEAKLSNSSFEYGDGSLGQLSIETDSVSRISLPSKHLLKANIKTRE